jgi:hypothetical protein
MEAPQAIADAAKLADQETYKRPRTPKPVEPKIDAKQLVDNLASGRSSDAFDFISLTALSQIAKSAGVTDAQAHRLIGLFIDSLR